MTGWRTTWATAGVMAVVAGIVLQVAIARDGGANSFGPGELDVLLAARSMAAGVFPPLWVGAVHPDAPGTWLGALLLSVPLRLGLPDLIALKGLAGLHFAVMVGVTAGMATRRAGVIGGALVGAILTFGAPAMVAAHSKYLATTVEVMGLQLALLWAAMELLDARAGRGAAVAALGAGLGLAMVYSLHSCIVAGVIAAALLWDRGQRLRRALLLAIPAALVIAPFVLMRDPHGPPRGALSVKTLGPGQLLGLLDPGDLGVLLRRAPFALLSETEHIPPDSWLRLLHVPLAVALAGAVLVGAALALRGMLHRRDLMLLGLALGAGAPLLLAGDLLGYPAAYRYFLPLLPPAAALLATGVVRGTRTEASRVVAMCAVAALTVPGLWTAPLSTATELSRPMAAYVAGQHRLGFARQALHTHFLMLTPFVRDDELAGWLQGYGVHIGREFTRQAPIAEQEAMDRARDAQTAVPEVVDRLHLKTRPERWLAAADWLGERARRDLLLGVGLGIGEDGILDPLDMALLRAAGADGPAVWWGVGAALGERWHWRRASAPLIVDWDLGPLGTAESGSLLAGLRRTGGRDAPPLERLLGPGLRPRQPAHPLPGVRLAHPHPFTYADLGVLGRGEVPMGPR